MSEQVTTVRLCPRCESHHFTPREVRVAEVGEAHIHRFPYPALSRTDNATDICSPCGQDEAMRDWGKLPPIPPDEWPIDQHNRRFRFKEINDG